MQKMDPKNLKHLLPPQKQIFWRRLAMSLQFMALGFSHWWNMPRQPKYFIVIYYVTAIFGPGCFCSQIIYLYIHFSDYHRIQIVKMFGVIMMTFCAVVRVFTSLRSIYKKVMIDFIARIHIYNYQPRNPLIDEVLIKCSRYDRYLVPVISAVILANTLVWIIVPIINNVISGAFTSGGTIKLETLLYMLAPFDYEYNVANWCIIHSISIYVSVFGSLVIGLFDGIMLCIVNHMIGRIKILRINFEDLQNNIDDYSNEVIAKKLSICVRDHVTLLGYFIDLQDSHGLGVTAYYAYNLIFDALILIQFTYGDLVTKAQYVLIVIIFVGGLVAMSLIMEEIRIESDELSNMLYFIPWERMSIPNKRIFLVLLMRIQKHLVFKAFAGLEAGIRPVFSIMKSTFSYYVMFKQRAFEEES